MIKNNSHNEQLTFFFLCHPDLGILDNWLPVIYNIKKKFKSSKLVMILPKSSVVTRLGLDNVIYKIADQIFDEIIVRAPSGVLLRENSLSASYSDSTYLKFLFRLLSIYEERVKKISFFKIIVEFFLKIYRWISVLANRESVVNMADVVSKKDVLLYDIHVENHELLNDILPAFYKCYRFSIDHGVIARIENSKIKKIVNTTNLKVFLFSDFFQRKYYREKYALSDQNLSVVGILKHDENWITLIKKQSLRLPDNFNGDDTVILFSRAISSYLRRDRKEQSVRDIKKVVIDELGMKLVIKTHPKEFRDTTFDKILGKENYGKNWIYSDLHPFVLGDGKKITISFYTGIAFDMNRIGVACIEYFNWDYDTGFVDSDGVRISSTVDLGMVIGAHNHIQLRSIIESIMKGSNKYTEGLMESYMRYFPLKNNNASIVASDIISTAMSKIHSP